MIYFYLNGNSLKCSGRGSYVKRIFSEDQADIFSALLSDILLSVAGAGEVSTQAHGYESNDGLRSQNVQDSEVLTVLRGGSILKTSHGATGAHQLPCPEEKE